MSSLKEKSREEREDHVEGSVLPNCDDDSESSFDSSESSDSLPERKKGKGKKKKSEKQRKNKKEKGKENTCESVSLLSLYIPTCGLV